MTSKKTAGASQRSLLLNITSDTLTQYACCTTFNINVLYRLRSFHHNVTAELISISRLQTRFYLLTSYLSLFNEHQMTCDPGPPGATCLTDPGPGDQLSALRELPPISDPGTNHRLLLTHWSLHWPRCSGAPGCYCYISCEPVIPVLTLSNKIGTGS